MSDGDLVRQTLGGKAAAYDQLVRQWAPRVLAVCRARVARGDAAEELAQEALYRSYKALHTLTDPDKFGPWICGIATRVCLDWLKSRRRSTVQLSAMENQAGLDNLPDPRSAADPANGTEQQDDLQRLMAEVERLPEKHREVLMLYYSHDCTYDDLARMLEVSAATINARLTQARQMLRQKLLGHEHHPRPVPQK